MDACQILGGLVNLNLGQILYLSLSQMNLRSVFTAEQQRILERYYENGMTNQSKACFQLILQCAQEAKLDFSVVRVKSLFVCDKVLPNI